MLKWWLFIVLWLSAVSAQAQQSAAGVAQQLGLPTIDQSGHIAGPFVGPANTLYYVDRNARITFLHPTELVAWLGTLASGGVNFSYGFNLHGQYVVDASNQAHQVAVLPDAVYQWPHAEAVANVLIQYLTAVQQQQMAPPSGQLDWQAMSASSAALHNSTMSILNNMGSQGCTEHYDTVYYLGCW